MIVPLSFSFACPLHLLVLVALPVEGSFRGAFYSLCVCVVGGLFDAHSNTGDIQKTRAQSGILFFTTLV